MDTITTIPLDRNGLCANPRFAQPGVPPGGIEYERDRRDHLSTVGVENHGICPLVVKREVQVSLIFRCHNSITAVFEGDLRGSEFGLGLFQGIADFDRTGVRR
jgi:hypothetical protein